MSNTTYITLVQKALQLAGNQYNANDTTKITLAKSIINDVLAKITSNIKGSPYTLDIGNTVATVASQAYVDLTDTDIIEILSFSQRSTNVRSKQITYDDYLTLVANPTLISGVPDLYWAPTQTVVTGVPTWRVYLVPTPSAVITMYYDYVKSPLLSANGDYSPLPPVYDRWIYAEFRPIYYSVIDPTNYARIRGAEKQAMLVREECMRDLSQQISRVIQLPLHGEMPYIFKPVATTPATT